VKQTKTAQLIDCGLTKFVTKDSTRKSDNFREYPLQGFGYQVIAYFASFGVFLTETFIVLHVKQGAPIENDVEPNLNVAIDGSIHSYDVHDFIIQTFECLTESIKNRPTGDDVSKSRASGLDNCILQVASQQQ
jgi:hypothetical protein